jgi:chromosome segregation ATPase
MVGAAASLPPMMMTVPESAAPSAAATPTAGTTPTASAAATSAEVEALRATLALKEEQLEAAQQRLRAAQTEAADLHEQSNRSRGFLEEERRLHGEERGRCQALEAALTAARSEGAALRETVAGASAVHAQEMESLKRLHEAGAQQLAEHAAADRVNVQAMAHEERNRALEAMAQVHQKELEARQAEWRAEVEMLSRHYTTADTLTELTARVQHGSSFLDELQERVVGEREKAARDRQQRLIQQEKNLESREAALATREREVVHMRAQVRNENTHRRPSRSLRLSSLIVLALGKRGVRRVV